jgi:hypothetical protein
LLNIDLWFLNFFVEAALLMAQPDRFVVCVTLASSESQYSKAFWNKDTSGISVLVPVDSCDDHYFQTMPCATIGPLLSELVRLL